MSTSPTPFYDANGITIYCGKSEMILPALALDPVDLVLTDPPYDEETHEGARTHDQDTDLIDFDPISFEDVRALIASLAPLARAWFVATMAWSHVARLKEEPPDGWRFVRFGIWVKPNGAPQFTGDRPGTGWEAVCHLHRDNGPMRWNGGGRHGVYIHDKISSKHRTGKPPGLLRELIELFSDPGDLVLDPFMGGGPTLVAARDLGRRAVGIERDERHCAEAVRRLGQGMLPAFSVAGARSPRKGRDLWKLYGDALAGKGIEE